MTTIPVLTYIESISIFRGMAYLHAIEVGHQHLIVQLTQRRHSTDCNMERITDRAHNLYWYCKNGEHCRYAIAGTEPVVAVLVGGLRGAVEKVFPFKELVSFSCPSPKRTAELKHLAASFLGLHYVLSDEEREVLQREADAVRVDLQPTPTKRRRKDEIAKRRTITARFENGTECHGLPVVGDEWKSAPNKQRVISVVHFDHETGRASNPIETFIVFKSGGGKCRRANVRKVHADHEQEQTQKRSDCPKPVGTIMIEIGCGLQSVQVFQDMDTIRKAREYGLNNHTRVTALDQIQQGKFQVHVVHSSGVKTLGAFVPLTT